MNNIHNIPVLDIFWTYIFDNQEKLIDRQSNQSNRFKIDRQCSDRSEVELDLKANSFYDLSVMQDEKKIG